MNWKSAKKMLRNGEKITRPNWEAEHFWVMSQDGFERILGYDGTNARIHLKQLEATDWTLWREKEESLNEKVKKLKLKLLDARKIAIKNTSFYYADDNPESWNDAVDGLDFALRIINKILVGDKLC